MAEETIFTLSEKLPKDHAEVLERLAKENYAIVHKDIALVKRVNTLQESNDAWCRSVFARGFVRASYDPAYRFLRQLAWLGLLDKTGKNTAEIMQAAAEEKLDLEHVRHILEELLAPEALEAVPPAGHTFTMTLGGKKYVGHFTFEKAPLVDMEKYIPPPYVVSEAEQRAECEREPTPHAFRSGSNMLEGVCLQCACDADAECHNVSGKESSNG